MQKNKYNKLNFYYFGWIYKISEIKFTKNKIAYVNIRCCSYKNEWWNFIIFETVSNLQNLKIGNWVKLNGILKTDLKNSKTIAEVTHFENLNKTEILENAVPDIENELWGEFKNE